MSEEENLKNKVEQLEQKLDESNKVGALILSMTMAILIAGAVSGFNPFVIGVLFFLIYWLIGKLK